jgi:ATP synthase protein I
MAAAAKHRHRAMLPQCTERLVGSACGIAAQRRKNVLTQRLKAIWRILDRVGGGKYGPRGFGGGEKLEISSTSRVLTMSGGTRERGDQGKAPTDEAALSARLKSLGARLDQAGPRVSETGPAARSATDHSGFARGFRLSSELVAGVLVGAGLGWLIDRWLGSLPWGTFVFALLGFTAGVLNVMRQAGVAPGGVPDSTIERRND